MVHRHITFHVGGEYDLSKYPDKEKIAGIEEHFKNKEGYKVVGDILYSPKEFKELEACEIKEEE